MVKFISIGWISPATRRRGVLRSCRRAFTLVEVLVSMVVVGTTATSLIWALTMMNKSATLGRLYTGATAAAQEQIDLVLTDGPFAPNSNLFLAELPNASAAASTVTETVPIYQETPTSPAITGTMTTVIEDTNATFNSYDSTDLNIYRITVTVAFSYRGQPKRVTLATMRSPDT